MPSPRATRQHSVAAPADEFTSFPLPAEFASQTVAFDVRQFADGVENLTDNFRPAIVTFDADLEDETGIVGIATFLSTEIRAGGGDSSRARSCPRLGDSIKHAVAEGCLEAVSSAPSPGDG